MPLRCSCDELSLPCRRIGCRPRRAAVARRPRAAWLMIRPGHIRGSRRTFPSGGSSLTSAPGGSAKYSPTARPSLA